jgi:hypothetical protein
MKQTTNDVDQVKRLSSPDSSVLTIETIEPYTSLQKTNYGRTSTDGSPHWIHQPTITLRVVLVTRKW